MAAGRVRCPAITSVVLISSVCRREMLWSSCRRSEGEGRCAGRWSLQHRISGRRGFQCSGSAQKGRRGGQRALMACKRCADADVCSAFSVLSRRTFLFESGAEARRRMATRPRRSRHAARVQGTREGQPGTARHSPTYGTRRRTGPPCYQGCCDYLQLILAVRASRTTKCTRLVRRLTDSGRTAHCPSLKLEAVLQLPCVLPKLE